MHIGRPHWTCAHLLSVLTQRLAHQEEILATVSQFIIIENYFSTFVLLVAPS